MSEAIMLVGLVVISLYLGYHGVVAYREWKAREKDREKEIYDAMLHWMQEPNAETEFRVNALIERYRQDRGAWPDRKPWTEEWGEKNGKAG